MVSAPGLHLDVGGGLGQKEAEAALTRQRAKSSWNTVPVTDSPSPLGTRGYAGLRRLP